MTQLRNGSAPADGAEPADARSAPLSGLAAGDLRRCILAAIAGTSLPGPAALHHADAVMARLADAGFSITVTPGRQPVLQASPHGRMVKSRYLRPRG